MFDMGAEVSASAPPKACHAGGQAHVADHAEADYIGCCSAHVLAVCMVLVSHHTYHNGLVDAVDCMQKMLCSSCRLVLHFAHTLVLSKTAPLLHVGYGGAFLLLARQHYTQALDGQKSHDIHQDTPAACLAH